MRNKILLIGGTHGNEKIGIDAIVDLRQKRQDFDWIIGNPRACRKNTRCIDADLNRSAPGNFLSLQYEKRRAKKLLLLSRKYQYTIDIHGSNRSVGVFVIITNPTAKNMLLAKKIGVENIVIWPAFSPELSGPLSQYFPNGFELECGPQNDPKIKQKLINVLDSFLDQVDRGRGNTVRQRFFLVYGSFKSNTNSSYPKEWSEFKSASWQGENFYPLLISSYAQRNNVYCYKMKLINECDIVK